MIRAQGIDTSHWEGHLDPNKAFAAGASFVYAKTSQWAVDPSFQDTMRNSKGILKRGGYHFLDWGWSVMDQAKLFCSLMAPDIGELPPVLDLEMDPAPYKLTAAQVSGYTWNFLTYVEQTLKVTPMLYVGYYYWNQWGGTDKNWTHFPLWLPWYAPELIIRAPKPWTKWTFWQDSSKADGIKYGCQSKNVDHNYFNGAVADLGQAPVSKICSCCGQVIP